jgi:glycosyltransferase involved in cell wall biosynthesis
MYERTNRALVTKPPMTPNRWLQTAGRLASLIGPEIKQFPKRSSKAYRIWREFGFKGIQEKIRTSQTDSQKKRTNSKKEREDYVKWVAMYDTLSEADRQAISARILRMAYKPLISVVMPVYNVDEVWLRSAIESVIAQLYPRWELCIADDGSSKRHVRRVLKEYLHKDPRIKVTFRNTRGHISVASNSAVELAEGEFIALLDHDDELTEHALYMVAEELNAFPESDLIYSDEDKLDKQGKRVDPHFKSDWNPDLFYSYNFISHLGVYRRSVVNDLRGFREGYEGSQDYDLALRVVEQISDSHIRHIPYILYHWREVPGSVARAVGSTADEAARNALQSHFRRKGTDATVSPGCGNFHRVNYPMPAKLPLVSVIIATRDYVNLLRQVVEGILHGTDYQPLELIIVDNQSSEPATLEYLRELQSDARVRIIQYDAPFNFSAIHNLAAREATGQILALVNNDIRIISSEWLREMVSHAVRPEIGAVGAKLYYENETIQHAGIIVGIGGVAGHAHKRLSRQSVGYFARAQVLQNYSAVTGACLVVRHNVYDEVGGLNEVDLPIAFNDVDLCLRIQQKGYRILWTPYAELYHLESATRGPDTDPDKLPRFIREQEFMRSKWGDRLVSDPYYSQNLTLNKEDFSLDAPRRQAPWKVESDPSPRLQMETQKR